MRVRFVDHTGSPTAQGTPSTTTDRLFHMIKKHINDQHNHFLDLASQTSRILGGLIKTNRNKYYMRNAAGDKLQRMKQPALVNYVTETIAHEHNLALIKLERKLTNGLEAKGATIALICECQALAAKEIATKDAQLKEALIQTNTAVIEYLRGLKPTEIDATKDTVLIGEHAYRVSKRAILIRAESTITLTRGIPPSFTHLIPNPHAYIPTTLQTIVGTALLCNVCPPKFVINANSSNFTDMLIKLGGDLVVSLGPNQTFTHKTLAGTRIIIAPFSSKLQHTLRKLEKIGALVVISNPNNECIEAKGYKVLTAERNTTITPEWLLHGATPGLTPDTIPITDATTSEEMVQTATLQLVKTFIEKNNWCPDAPTETKEIRLIIPELQDLQKEQKKQTPTLNKELVAAALISLGYRCNKPTNRLTAAFRITTNTPHQSSP